MKIDNSQEATGNSRKAKVLCFALCAMLFALCGSAEAQQPAKIQRIGYLSAFEPAASPPVPSQFGWRCVSLAKDRTSPPSTDTLRGSGIGILSLRLSWWVLRLISS